MQMTLRYMYVSVDPVQEQVDSAIEQLEKCIDEINSLQHKTI